MKKKTMWRRIADGVEYGKKEGKRKGMGEEGEEVLAVHGRQFWKHAG